MTTRHKDMSDVVSKIISDINNIQPVEEAKELEEAPLVTTIDKAFDTLVSYIKSDIMKDRNSEKSFVKLQRIADIAGLNVTNKEQTKGMVYMYDLAKRRKT